jgi:hypothetical protein
MGRLVWGIGKRVVGDSRVTLFRYETSRYIYGGGWKVSISLHPRWFYWQRCYGGFRVTLFGVNLHWRVR